MEIENRVLAPDEIYRLLMAAMREKSPRPPDGWSASKLEEEIFRAGKPEQETDLFLRQTGALETALFYLVDFAARMPERVNLSETNGRVKKMCEALALEIEKITRAPGAGLAREGKLKVRLVALLAVETCLIYREETERYLAEEEAEKRLSRSPQANAPAPDAPQANGDQEEPRALQKNVRRKAGSSKAQDSSAQLSLF